MTKQEKEKALFWLRTSRDHGGVEVSGVALPLNEIIGLVQKAEISEARSAS